MGKAKALLLVTIMIVLLGGFVMWNFNKDTDGDGLTDWNEMNKYRTNPTLKDSDGDSLSDYNEIFTYRTNPLKNDTDEDGLLDGDEVINYKTDANSKDTDKDGLTDYEEIFTYHTDPLKNDTDGDNLTDYEEINYNTNPNSEDTDKDGLTDYYEIFKYRTNPLKNDTDRDGLSDYDERINYKTDPNLEDTDNDRLDDHEEITIYHTDPLTDDTDKDGLTDYEEIFTYKTNPLSKDSDGDDLDDYSEIFTYSSNPLNNDTDSDGLPDGAEVSVYNTDPTSNDTDGDYLPDGYEVKIGTNPSHDWRDSFDEETLKAGLSKLLRTKVDPLAKRFSNYSSTLDKAWEILSWIGDNIEYNYTKANRIDDIVANWSSMSENERELYNNLTRIQAANDTAYFYRSGVCTDYAILTAVLLLEDNVQPVYIFDINYRDREVGHATVAIRVNGDYFVLDQNLPPIPLGNYYWSSIHSGMGEISDLTVYKVTLEENMEIKIENWTWTSKDLKKMAYKFTDEDIELLSNLTKEYFIKLYPWYKEDTRLKNLAEKDLEAIKTKGNASNEFLPPGFTSGMTFWWKSSEYFVLYYHPSLAEKLIKYWWPGPAFLSEDWTEYLKNYNKYYLIIGMKTNDITTIRDSEGNTWETPEFIMVLEAAR